MDNGWGALEAEISQTAAALPADVITKLAEIIRTTDNANWAYLRARVLTAVSNGAAQARVYALLNTWQHYALGTTGEAVALALLTAAHDVAHRGQNQRIELVWTGPDSQMIPLRRTDQALLQLINSATQRLLIVSFAVYDIDEIARALLKAAQRGVAITICLETPDASAGRIAFDTLRALGDELRQHSRIYVWPLAKRPQSEDGRRGSLHAKVAVADGKTMLISSANLTGNAMILNMELGLLVYDPDLPAKIVAHFDQLIAKQVLQLVWQ